MPPLTIATGRGEVRFDDPGKARAAARRWDRMARELDTRDAPPAARERIRELRQRAKAANDWARKTEDRVVESEPPAAGNGNGSRPREAARRRSPALTPERRRAANTLRTTGVRRARQATTKARRRYERAGGFEISAIGEFAAFFAGSLLALVLLEDLLSARGSKSFAGAANTATALSHRLLAPVPVLDPIDLSGATVAATPQAGGKDTGAAAGFVQTPVLGAIPGAGGELRPPATTTKKGGSK